MKTNTFLILTLLFAIVCQISAQDKILLTEKCSTYKITYGTLNGQGPDQYNISCGEGRALVKLNPDCWVRTLTVTALQYLSWRYRPETEEELEKIKLPNGGLSDFVGLFLKACRLRN